MKVCIPTETNQDIAADVYGHFGSAPYFMIYDTESCTTEIVVNTNQHHSHGMCQPMTVLMDKKIDAVVCAGMGGRAVQRLNEGGVKAYRAIQGTAQSVVDQFLKGGLEEITVVNACIQHDCH